MNNKYLIFYIAFCLLACFSCKNNIKDLNDGGTYKFWFCIGESGNVSFSYFGCDGKYLVFRKNATAGFHRYGTVAYEDDLPLEKWSIKNDSIDCAYTIRKILDINENRMILQNNNRKDTFYSVPQGMIPLEFDHKW